MLIEVNKMFVYKDDHVSVDIKIGQINIIVNNIIIQPNGTIKIEKGNPFCNMLLDFGLLEEKEEYYTILDGDLNEMLLYIYNNKDDNRRYDKIERVNNVRII